MRQRRSPRRFALLATFGALTALSGGGCRDRQPKPLIEHAAVVRCERGVQHASAQPTMEKALSVYHRACAEIHSQPACRQAFVHASKAPAEKHMEIVVNGCKKAYCPVLGADQFEICRADFQATPAGLNRAWPPFHGAIIKHDGQGLEPRINNALLSFYLKSQEIAKREAEGKTAKGPDGGAAPPAGSEAPPAGSAAPAGSVPAGSAVPTGSAVPPGSAAGALAAPPASAPAASATPSKK